MKTSNIFSANFFLFFFLGLFMLEFSSCNWSTQQQGAAKNDTIVIPSETIFEKNVFTKNGEEIKKYDNGIINIKGYYRQGKREGQWVSFYRNGLPWSEANYEGGLKNGATASYYENGNKRYAGFYANDNKTGKWSFWDEQGKPVKVIDFGNGKSSVN